MKIRKGIKLKVSARMKKATDPALSQAALQSWFDSARSAYAELEVKITAVQAPAPGELALSFVIKGECEAAADFAAYTNAAVRHLVRIKILLPVFKRANYQCWQLTSKMREILSP